ncbi:LysE family translocator [Microbacterium caowuchunii]|uniref:LysE family translocator n=1 Tax=Microbacterium caowuchunii TaxID=2614638 RepID=UPI0012487241|nr:LysE family translocator [Microbacterium caowuchunii]QEW01034.1 LysE family translocator [Microbacterium caowuchunii]
MVPLENLLAFALAAIVIIVIPGPGVLFVIGRSLALGRLGGLLSVVGGVLGQIPLVLAVAFGLGAVVAQSEVLFTVVKVAGAGYLVFLGVQAIRHRKRSTRAAAGGIPPRSHGRQLLEGFVVGVTNPKTIAFFVAVLPQFVDPAAGWIPLQMLELGLVFLVFALVSDAAWALLAGAARGWFARSPKRIETLSATGGGMIIGLGGALLFTGSAG